MSKNPSIGEVTMYIRSGKSAKLSSQFVGMLVSENLLPVTSISGVIWKRIQARWEHVYVSAVSLRHVLRS